MEDRKKRDFENFHGGSSRGDGYGGDNKILKIDQFQEGRNFYPNMDPKILRESIAARSSSQRSKQRKPQNVIELEMQIKALQTRIGFLHSQIEANENKKFSLLVEQQAMKLQIVAKEKVRLLKEVEIEKNRAEVNELNKVLRIQEDALTQMMMGHNSNLRRFNLNSIPSTSNEAQNGEE